MRRLALLALAAALLSGTSAAAAALVPLRPHRGSELGRPLIRAGPLHVPPGHARAEVRVVVRLRPPPLAAAATGNRLSLARGGARLQVGGSSSRAYLRYLDARQAAAAAAIRRSIPAARIGRRYRVVLDGFAVTLPARRLPALVRLGAVSRVYPSLRYTLATNDSPGLIAAPQLSAATGARGEGMKIAVVDDGIDQKNRFFRPGGFTYPAGFPKGQRAFTTAKVIVARAFPGPGAGKRGRLPLDRRDSFHGTHVAGIAAGDAGTTAPKGLDHPAVAGLSGVAPRAQLGSYRVFTVPTPLGNVANTPEIIAAFESAVRDGMDVINFSGGGPQVDPVSDALEEAIANVARAGVVPVISAGNDRDDFGFGTAGSPGTAPEAITVAAVTNNHVFTPELQVRAADAPASVARLAFQPGALELPRRWATSDRTLVDVSSLVGRNGKPVTTRLCGTGKDPNGARNPLRSRSLRGAIALVSRGGCTFASKAERVRLAGGVGMVVIDNRPGEATAVSVLLDVPAGSIADLDGARLRAYLAGHGGRTRVRIGTRPLQVETGRGGVVASFSAGGPTAFGHLLKPDVAAPGSGILSSTLREFAGSPFAVFDGTSMAAPHVSGAAALLLQLHPAWTVHEVRSALVSTAGPAWGDTARTQEAAVTLEGAGLIDVVRAARPELFTDPSSLSFGDLDVTGGPASEQRLLTLTDAGGGAGTWSVEVQPQSATPGAAIDVPGTVTIAPGGSVSLPVGVRASAQADVDASGGLDYGFLVLRRGDLRRRVPYLFLVTRPRLEGVRALPLRRVQRGTTAKGVSRVAGYRFPTAPFGTSPLYDGRRLVEGGAERLYARWITRPVANAGAAITSYSPGTALIHPWFLGSADENDVQGYAGTPVNVNSFTLNYGLDLGAAGTVFPRQGRYFVAVDSGGDPFTGKQLRGRYVLRSWVNDVTPPRVRLVTARLAAGRPLVVARATDRGAGVDPYSILLGYGRILLTAAAYDPDSGLVVFYLPDEAPALRAGRRTLLLTAADYQESKNVLTPGDAVLPNTAFRSARARVVRGPAASFVAPRSGTCVRRGVRLLVVASSTARIRNVRFSQDGRVFRIVRHGPTGLYRTTWRPRGGGRHVVRALATDAKGRTAATRRTFRVCR